jgi:polyisoprenoid-binding protein YceI
MSRGKRIIAAVGVAAVVVGGAAAWWFLSDDPPDELAVDDVLDESSGSASGSGSDAGSDGSDLDGTWTVAEGRDSQAGLRITESFVGGLADHTAVGRTTGVTGSIEVDGLTVESGRFTVDLTGLEWSDRPGFPTDNRSLALRDQALETDTFPDATFEITEPALVDELPAAGGSITVDVSGDLTLHGVTKPATFAVDVARDGDQVVIGTTDPVLVVLAEHEIEEPQTPSLAGVADEGHFEFVVVLTQD